MTLAKPAQRRYVDAVGVSISGKGSARTRLLPSGSDSSVSRSLGVVDGTALVRVCVRARARARACVCV